MMMLASILFFSCKKNQNKPAENTLAIRMSNELIAAINNDKVASEEVLNYFSKGNQLVPYRQVSLTVKGETRVLQVDQKFAVNEATATAEQTSSIQGK